MLAINISDCSPTNSQFYIKINNINDALIFDHGIQIKKKTLID